MSVNDDLCWEDVYQRDIVNFMDNGDVGHIWFGAQETKKIIEWLKSQKQIDQSDSIVDIGCGNGMMLIELARAGYSNLMGTDYSPNAISLAKIIAEKDGFPLIQYEVHDILSSDIPVTLRKEFTVAIDKGTYDALTIKDGSAPVRVTRYMEVVYRLLAVDGLLIIVTCNWTEEEICDHFKNYFKPIHVMPKKKFSFGSGVGSTTSTVVFKKLANVI